MVEPVDPFPDSPQSSGPPIADAASTEWLGALLNGLNEAERRHVLDVISTEPPREPGQAGPRLKPSRPRRRLHHSDPQEQA